jgi:flagellar hook-associated protein 3 FlgL
MRISTNMIYNAGVGNINRQMAAALKLQEQIATNRRIVNPSDDPVAAAQALQVQQAKDVNDQFATNLDNAKSALGLEEAQLTTVNDIFGRVKELAIEAGSGALSSADRQSIALELRARFDELVGIANSTDGTGQFIFAGYMGDTQPFAGTVDGGVSYAGDDGQRRLQISASRLLETSDSGLDVFMRIPDGNGTFSTTYGAGNTGSGVISGGAVSDPSAWVAPSNGASYTLVFTSATTYDLRDGATVLSSGTYASGQAIPLQNGAVSLGASVTVTGMPAAGDSFAITPSTSQSVFETIADLIRTVEGSTATAADAARYQIDLGNSLANLGQASDNILQVRAAIGARLHEVDTVDSINSDVGLQYDETLSNLQDLDMVKALTDLTRKQTDLEAAQKSFTMVSQLSLFNYL